MSFVSVFVPVCLCMRACAYACVCGAFGVLMYGNCC